MLRSARQLSRKTILASLFFATLLAIPVAAQQATSPPSEPPVGFPVTVEGNQIFLIYDGIGSVTAPQRAAAVSERIRKLIYTKDDLSTIKGADSPYGTAVMLGDSVLAVITDDDAKHYHASRLVAANYLANRVREALGEARRQRTPRFLIEAAIKATVTLAIYLVLVWLVVRIGRWLLRKLQATATRMKGIRIQQSQIMAGERIAAMLMTAVRLLRILLLFLFTWILLATEFNYFPWTREHGRQLRGYILTPVEVVGKSFVNYLPNLFYIIIIVAVIHYVMKFIRLLAGEIERGNIRLHGFYPEWSQPTYKIVRFLMIAFTAVMIYPYLPGNNSPAFKGIGLFIGVLFSLGSTSAVANVVAGVILTYTRGFRVGDWVKIGDNMGEITAQSMLATHLKTIKNEEIIIPNSVILGSYVTNYSLLAQKDGLILYTSVTIGYDEPWRKIHQLLIEAALKTKNILQTPAPFVLQTALDDSYVQYEINAYTDKPVLMVFTYSDLRANIQDSFFNAGVEIMSPTFHAVRDGNRTAMPEEFLPPDYRPRAFRVEKDDAASAASSGKS